MNEFHKELIEKAPKLMEFFCKVYGYTLFEGQYYNNYLLNSTDIKGKHYGFQAKIKRLQNKYDGNLENFKLQLMPVVDHLSANGYHFDIKPLIDNQEVEYYIKIIRVKDGIVEKIPMPENYEKHCYFGPALEVACLIACQDCERYFD